MSFTTFIFRDGAWVAEKDLSDLQFNFCDSLPVGILNLINPMKTSLENDSIPDQPDYNPATDHLISCSIQYRGSNRNLCILNFRRGKEGHKKRAQNAVFDPSQELLDSIVWTPTNYNE